MTSTPLRIRCDGYELAKFNIKGAVPSRGDLVRVPGFDYENKGVHQVISAVWQWPLRYSNGERPSAVLLEVNYLQLSEVEYREISS